MKVGLITPYGGTNLGDAAIQESVIHNIRLRFPGADIRLVTLAPEKTSELHGVVSYPLTALAVGYYSQGLPIKKNQPHDETRQVEFEAQGGGVLGGLKAGLKKFPGLFLALKRIHQGGRVVARVPGLIRGEVSHFFAARKFMKGADLLLVSGGGQLDDYWGGAWGHPYSLFKWGLIAWSLHVRYVFLGVGTCALESRLSIFFIRQALRLAVYRSYRDQTSKKLLENMPFTHSDPIGPDLAFSFDQARLATGGAGDGEGKTVGISPIAYLRHNWPKQDDEVYSRYLDHLVQFISRLVRQGYSIHLFTTDSPDRHGVGEIIDLLSRERGLDVAGKVRQVRTDTLSELLPSLAMVDYVVASRLHGVILGHLVQKPVLAISYDRKVGTYMKDTGFVQYCLDIYTFNADLLMTKFESLVEDNDAISSELKNIRVKYSNLLSYQYDLILEC